MKTKSYVVLAVAAAAFTLAGCATRAGPFVTAVSSDGRGGLTVEKCMVKFDPWMAVVNNDSCTATNIQLEKR